MSSTRSERERAVAERAADTDAGAANVTAPPAGEAALLTAIQARLNPLPGAVQGSKVLSLFGEHALGWFALSGLGVALDAPRRRGWFAVGTSAFLAHAASVVLKRVVRRRRPHDPAIQVNVGTPSRLSFPSSHATSTAAWAVAAAQVTGSRWPLAVVPPMVVSRLVAGVHYPSDVLGGALLGGAVAAAVVPQFGPGGLVPGAAPQDDGGEPRRRLIRGWAGKQRAGEL